MLHLNAPLLVLLAQVAQDVAGTSRTDRLSWHWTDSGIWAALSVRLVAKC